MNQSTDSFSIEDYLQSQTLPFEGLTPLFPTYRNHIYYALDRLTNRPVILKVPQLRSAYTDTTKKDLSSNESQKRDPLEESSAETVTSLIKKREDPTMAMGSPYRVSRDMLQEVQNQTRILNLLTGHQYIQQISGAGDFPFPYVATEFVKGVSLSRFIARAVKYGSRIKVSDCIGIVKNVCSALNYVHDNGIIHRDIKLGNILVREHSYDPVLIDFDIAKWVNDEFDISSVDSSGEIIGTPNYLAPEHLKFGSLFADNRSDIFSLGLVFYDLLTGISRDLPRVNSHTELTQCVQHSLDLPWPSTVNTFLESDCDLVFLKSTAPNPALRYQSADQFRKALEDLEEEYRLKEALHPTEGFISPPKELHPKGIKEQVIKKRPNRPLEVLVA